MQVGRPTDYTLEKADLICDRITQGESLRSICIDEDMPHAGTVCRWLAKNQEFREQYALAREAQAELMADELLEIADDGTNDWMEKKNAEGEVIGYRENGEAMRRSQLRISTRQWVAERLLPKKYGTKVQNEHTGKDGGAIETKDVGGYDLARRIALALASTDGRTS